MHDIHNQPALIFDGISPRPLPWPLERTVCFGAGREALVALCRAIAPRRRRVALVPAYVPEGVHSPFRRCGWDVRLYPIDRRLDPDWDALAAMLPAAEGGAAVLIHYFGLAKPAERFAEMCRRHGVLAIEDRGHVVPEPEMPLWGDVVLYSLPKVLGVPDGAPLILRDPSLDPAALGFRPHPLRHLVNGGRMMNLLAASLSRRLPAGLGRRVRGVVGLAFDPYRFAQRISENPAPMSSLSRALLARIDLGKHAERRRAHARRYEAGLDRSRFERFQGGVPDVHAGIGFPVRVPERGALIAALKREGIQGAFYQDLWDFIPAAERARHVEAVRAMEEHFLFPTWPGLSGGDVDFVIAAANRWASRGAAGAIRG